MIGLAIVFCAAFEATFVGGFAAAIFTLAGEAFAFTAAWLLVAGLDDPLIPLGMLYSS
jgi:hypothetical protein